MSTTNRQKKTPMPHALRVLTSSALLLPGLFNVPALAADDDEVDFQYSHYQEGKRDIYGVFADPNTGNNTQSTKLPSKLSPIEVDSLHGMSRISLTDRVKFAFNYLQDTWSGATPVGTAPAVVAANKPEPNDSPATVSSASPLAGDIGLFYLDNKGNIYSPDNLNYDPYGNPLPGQKDNQLTHVMSYASPETRKQGDYKLGYEWDEAAVNVGGGISVENDYESRFANLGGRLDFNQKRTTVNLGLSYTNSDTHAFLDPNAAAFFNYFNYGDAFNEPNSDHRIGFANKQELPGKLTVTFDKNNHTTGVTLRGNRQDVGVQLGLSHVLSKDALLTLGMDYMRSTGYLGNPYKLAYTFSAAPPSTQDPNQPLLFGGVASLEIRPSERNQFNWNAGYTHYIEPLDAALHINYRFAHDDWHINAHTFEGDWVQPLGAGWTMTPRIRYYSQSQAFFYAPFFTAVQVVDPTTFAYVDSPLNRSLPNFYSSDQRLSGFGTLSGGVTVSKQFAKGVQLDTGFEYYTHQGGLKLGGGGEQGFADFNYWVANAALKINLGALSFHDGGVGDHVGHYHHHNNPAGVMFDHTLEKAGDYMVGYRFMRNEQAGDMLFGSKPVGTDIIAANACGDQACTVSPNNMVMNMHMLDLMYAPTNWLSLMLMPQWMDMDMDMTHFQSSNINIGHHAGIGSVPNHQVGGVGDTGLYALFKVWDQFGQQVNLSLGGTAPTGDVAIKLRDTAHNPTYDALIHYGMQLGSGTWDFKPSLTYTGEWDQFNWGAQLTGTKRLESRNKSNFVFGDIFQSSVWGGYQWTNWLSTTVRGIYTEQGAVRGHYLPVLNVSGDPFTPTHVGPFDSPANYGGEFVDLGLGINVNIPNGAFAGNALKFEWLQPINTHYHGYQLDRSGALAFTWNYGF